MIVYFVGDNIFAESSKKQGETSTLKERDIGIAKKGTEARLGCRVHTIL